ncbi:MAG: ArnT family glycosyltransferase [Candidatus Saccharimonadales bacterium]
MGKIKTTDFLLYRWRYAIGYLFLGFTTIGMLYVITFLTPGGISAAEMQSTVTSVRLPSIIQLANSPDSLMHWPYHILQSLSISLLGVSILSIKLPSIILALGSVIALYGLLRIWFRQNVAIISAIIAVTTGQFLFYTQLGTPEISYLFWNAALLACASLMARTSRIHWLWLLGTVVLGALSLYSPYQIYMVISLLFTSLFHPHARFIVFRQPVWLLALCIFIFTLLVTPLVLAFINDPALIMAYLGLPTDWSLLSWEYTKHVAFQYLAFWRAGNSINLTPIYGLGIILLGLLGLYRLFTVKYTAKSYIITIWLACLIPILFFNIGAVSLTFIPIMLLVAFAMDYLISRWYKIFPLNPYARVAGLIPLSVLVISLVLAGIERFVYGYHYDSRASQIFSNDISLLDNNLKALNKNASVFLFVDEKDVPFYATYSDTKKQGPKLIVSSSKSTTPTKPGTVTITDHTHQLSGKYPDNIIVNGDSVDANRFYLYKNR